MLYDAVDTTATDGAGNDSISVTGTSISIATLSGGAGNDTIAITGGEVISALLMATKAQLNITVTASSSMISSSVGGAVTQHLWSLLLAPFTETTVLTPLPVSSPVLKSMETTLVSPTLTLSPYTGATLPQPFTAVAVTMRSPSASLGTSTSTVVLVLTFSGNVQVTLSRVMGDGGADSATNVANPLSLVVTVWTHRYYRRLCRCVVGGSGNDDLPSMVPQQAQDPILLWLRRCRHLDCRCVLWCWHHGDCRLCYY